jgi:guanine deaminase
MSGRLFDVARVLRGQLVAFGKTHHDVLHETNGALVVEAGRIVWRGAFASLPQRYGSAPVEDFETKLLMAGFVDAHIHFPQYRILAAPAKDLLDWLHRFTFPEEARYGDLSYAQQAADIFLNRLFSHGTTSALAFCSVHRECADALFAAASKHKMALITGKTMMDRNAIPAVQDTAEQGARESEALYTKWHGKERLRYAVTPRFAVTSSEAQLAVSGELLKSLPGALIQTHISESAGEIEFVKSAFPWSKDYADVYDRYGLLSDRSLFAHGIHLSERECARLFESGSSVIHCPTSNAFLGSGIMRMPYMRDQKRPVLLGVATDVGGGTSYSMLTTLAETYKLQMLGGYKPSAHELFHMATRGNAGRLHMGDETGSLDVGKFADVIVLDPEATPVLKSRQELSLSLEDMLFALMMLGDDRAVTATYVAGERVYPT